jgi:malate synthase
MEDAATAEISRAQVWQWIRHPKGVLNDGRKVTFELVEQLKLEEMQKLKQNMNEDSFTQGRYSEAITLFDELIREDEFQDFLTNRGYEVL